MRFSAKPHPHPREIGQEAGEGSELSTCPAGNVSADVVLRGPSLPEDEAGQPAPW
jgi:hypothetical protein